MIWSRPGPPPPAPPEGDRPWEFNFDSVDLDIDPRRLGAEEAGRVVAARIAEGLAANQDTASMPDLGGLADAAGSRVAMLIDPEPGLTKWLEQVRRHGTPPAPLASAEVTEEARDRWARAARPLQGARLSSESIRLAATVPDAPPKMAPGTRFIRPSPDVAGSSYPKPPSDSTRCVEVQLKAEFADKDGKKLPATVALRLWHDGKEWRPFEMTIYFDEQSFGRSLTFPAF
ncbi:MAG: hypothetical protein RBS39_02940 [Phycisphaerales bacterium]|jgi:hypothetical protein|nr:hypothetical protein [Phycisphaerales bacterium]